MTTVSLWGISLKTVPCKLNLEDCSPETLLGAAQAQAFQLLSLTPEDACAFHHLPRTAHKLATLW